MLHELGVPADHEAVQGGLELILDACRDDGRIRVAPKAPLYPCYTAEAARVLCRFGLADNPSVQRTMRYLLDSVHGTGGWRYNFTRFGRGPDTRYANPGATLYALDALRFGTEHRAGVVAIDHAVESLLDHWGDAGAAGAMPLGDRYPVPAGRVPLPAVQPVLLRLRAVLLCASAVRPAVRGRRLGARSEAGRGGSARRRATAPDAQGPGVLCQRRAIRPRDGAPRGDPPEPHGVAVCPLAVEDLILTESGSGWRHVDR